MKRASYRDAIDWIAQNDSGAAPGADNPEIVGELVSSVLVADVFGVEPARVGRDVVRRRAALAKAAQEDRRFGQPHYGHDTEETP